MTLLVVAAVASLAAALTFFSGFGLGTLLLPAFAAFFPVDQAVALTAVVHFLNGLFKLALVGRHADRRVVLRFGLPAMVAAFAGAALLIRLAGLPPLHEYTISGRPFAVVPVKLVIGILLLLFTLAELLPRFRDARIGPRWLPLGGVLSGFFGGLSGHQGALRTAFLARAGLSKEAFIATGAAIACLIDVTRLGLYARNVSGVSDNLNWGLLGAAVLAAFAGSLLGNRFLKKMTLAGVQRVVAGMLVVFALALIIGVV